MDCEKKYKDALERASKLRVQNPFDTVSQMMEHIFPELAESEDEKVRKELIAHCRNIKCVTEGAERITKWLAWLEKQKEFVSADFDDVWETADCDELTAPLEKYSKDAIKEMCHAWYDKGIELERKKWLEKQGEQINLPQFTFDDILALQCVMETVKKVQEDKDLYEKLNDLHGRVYDAYQLEAHGKQKPADKVEPKFHEGEWVIDKQGIVHQIFNVIENVTNHTYAYDIVGGGYFNDNTEGVRLWSINDARYGDVLVTNSNTIFIFKCLDEGGTIAFRASCTKNSEAYFPKLKERLCDQDVYPATKEQRDTLFAKMKEAGYEWNATKKELIIK